MVGMAANIAKQSLRKKMKEILSTLSEAEKLRQSQVVTAKLLQMPEYRRSHRIAAYLSKSDEVRTDEIIADILRAGKMCFIPRYWKGSTRMEMLRLYSVDEVKSLDVTDWGIRQPSQGDGDGGDSTRENALQTGGLDLILVPGRAFTASGLRLGRGGGYYDVFLRRCSRDFSDRRLLTVGLAFAQQLVEALPSEDTDFTLDRVLYNT